MQKKELVNKDIYNIVHNFLEQCEESMDILRYGLWMVARVEELSKLFPQADLSVKTNLEIDYDTEENSSVAFIDMVKLLQTEFAVYKYILNHFIELVNDEFNYDLVFLDDYIRKEKVVEVKINVNTLSVYYDIPEELYRELRYFTWKLNGWYIHNSSEYNVVMFIRKIVKEQCSICEA